MSWRGGGKSDVLKGGSVNSCFLEGVGVKSYVVEEWCEELCPGARGCEELCPGGRGCEEFVLQKVIKPKTGNHCQKSVKPAKPANPTKK